MLGGIESLRASGKFASPREAGRGRRAKRGGRGARPRARARLPLSLALSPLSRGEGIGQCPGVATPGFHGRVKPFGALDSQRPAVIVAPMQKWSEARESPMRKSTARSFPFVRMRSMRMDGSLDG